MKSDDVMMLIESINSDTNKWYFKIPIIGHRLARNDTKFRTNMNISLSNLYLRELAREGWHRKSKEEQYLEFKNVVNLIAEDMGLYTMTNWKEIIEGGKII